MLIFIYIFIIIIILLLGFSIYSIKNDINILKIKKKIIYNDEDYLNNVNILGTHNSLTYNINNYFSPFGKTQIANLETQYNLGSRFFDLRFQKKNNKLNAYHGIINLNLSFQCVFDIFLKILEKNQSFIIISIKEENESDNIDIKKDIYQYFVNQKKENMIVFNNKTIPKIKDIKNKFYFINIIDLGNNNYSFLSWPYNTIFSIYNLNVEDINDASIEKKINSIKKFINSEKNGNINLVFFSLQTNIYTSVKFISSVINNLCFKNKLLKHKKGYIFIFDYINNIYNFNNTLINDILI